jgi:predicted AlkP superfamily phosphohydrolase/phosphomutase
VRVFLFGVDGLTFRILHPMMERGLLPNFQKLCDDGVEGILKSTIPPLTPPAWMSISTGLSPAKHGVYDFWQYEQAEQDPQARVMTHRQGGKAIWNELSDWGKRVVVANVPLTYPAEPVNGIMLSGYMAPDMKANVTYPADFKGELLQAVPDYQIDLDPAMDKEQVGDVLTETLRMTRTRIAMLRLLLHKPWDFFFIVFTGADRIQHTCWEKITLFHPQAVAYYQMLDEALGMVLEALHAQDMLMVVSDHGFQGIRRQFYAQEYLHRQGLLQVRDSDAYRRAVLRNTLAGVVRKQVWGMGLQGVPTSLRRQLHGRGFRSVSKEQGTIRLPDLDWANTHAWLQSATGDLAGYADIFLDDSLTGEQTHELATALKAIHDPETGQQLVAEAYGEDAFGAGPFAPAERHLVLIAGENIMLKAELGHRNLWDTCTPIGIHHPEGVLYLYGAGVKSGVSIAPAHVYDVVPTILSCMDLPLSKELDGRVIVDAFDRPQTSFKAPSQGMQRLRHL